MNRIKTALTALACALPCAMAGAGTATAQEAGLETVFGAEDIRADFDALYAGLQSAHFDLYANIDKAEYDALHAAMRQGMTGPQDLAGIKLRFQEFTAFGKVAHASISIYDLLGARYREASGLLPLVPWVADGQLFVVANLTGDGTIAAGDEIVSINGRATGQWLADIRRYVSADTDAIAWSVIDGAFEGWLALDDGEAEMFEVGLRSGDGPVRHYRLEAMSPEEQAAALADRPESPLPGYNDREARLAPNGVAYLRPGPFYNAEAEDTTDPAQLYDVTGFTAFIDRAFEEFIEAGADTLLIDIRRNPGGDNSFSDPMTAWFADQPFHFASRFVVRSSPEAEASNRRRIEAAGGDAGAMSALYAERYEATPYGETFEVDIPMAPPREGRRFEGEVYVLIDRNSYSNAVNVAALLQDYGFATVIGEKTTDFATTYGAMEQFTLPRTGIEVGFPKALIVRPSGDMTPDGVTPDIAIEAPLVPGDRDSVLEKALEIAANGQ